MSTLDTSIEQFQTDMNTVHKFVQGGAAETVSLGGVQTATLRGLVRTFQQNRSIVGKATKAALDADLGYYEGQLAFVSNDSTATNNGFYLKTGASGSGSWTKSADTTFSDAVASDCILYYDSSVLTHTGGYIGSDGTVTESAQLASWGYSDYLPINGARQIKVSAGYVSAPVYQLSFYREDNSFISAKTCTQAGTAVTADVPSGATKIRLSGNLYYYLIAENRVRDAVSSILSGLDETTTQNLNQDKPFPFRQMTRNGVTSSAHPRAQGLFLNVRVVGAREGYYYAIRYVKNGNTALSDNIDGFIIEEQAADTYATSADARTVVTYRDPCPEFERDGKIHTIHIASIRDSELEFYITMDMSKLPAYGEVIAMNYPANGCYSWIIDPECYEYRKGNKEKEYPLKYEISSSAAKIVAAMWRDDDNLYRLRFGPNGFNSLPNVANIYVADYVDDFKQASWGSMNGGSTDWLPPLTVKAVNNGDGTETPIYTGGNHGSTGGADGEQTARNILYQIFIDDQLVTPQSSAIEGDAGKISFLIVNELMAYNTISLGRYVLRQTFHVDVHPGGMEVRCEVLPYEDIVINKDNGVQATTVNYQGTMLYAGGQYAARMTFDANSNSGTKASYPDAWAVVLQGDAGQQVSWMDREYEAGDGRYVGSSLPLIRGGGSSANTKFYHAVVSGDHSFSAGATYKWRGGYAWQKPVSSIAGIDSTFSFWKGGERHVAVVKTPAVCAVLP